MESNQLRQAIKTFIETFYNVRRLFNFMEDLPIRHEKRLLSYDYLTALKLTPKDIENLYHQLTYSTLTEDINNGIMNDFPDEQTISNRLRHLKYSINREDVFVIEDVESAYGAKIPTTKLLSSIMDYAEAYDYVNNVYGIYREWNLIVDCLNRVIKDIEKDFLNPQPESTTELPTIFQQFAILRDNFRVRNAFIYAIEASLMEVDGTYFKWLKKRQLLAYFCWSVSNTLIPDSKNVQWSVFNGMFIAKKCKEYEVENNETLRRCYIDYETKTRTHKKDTPPDGWKIVDEIIAKAVN